MIAAISYPLAAVSFLLFLNGGFSVWLYWHAHSGSDPNPRTVVNSDHASWQGFSVALHICGFFLGMMNMGMWFRYRDTVVVPWIKRKNSSKLSERFRKLVLLVHLLIILPIAWFTSTFPLFSPFVALPVAQQHAWLHRCDPYPWVVVLSGRPYDAPNQTQPLASFYSNRGRTKLFNYLLETNDAYIWSLNLQVIPGVEIPATSYPLISKVSYNSTTPNRTLSATCVTSSDTMNETTPCMEGSYVDSEYLRFFLNEIPTNTITNLSDTDKQWDYNDGSDAPSFILYNVTANNDTIVMRSAVTRTTNCTQLEICMADSTAYIPVIGVVLNAQDLYAQTCSKPTVG